MAGVNVRSKQAPCGGTCTGTGSVWADMLYSRARITVLDEKCVSGPIIMNWSRDADRLSQIVRRQQLLRTLACIEYPLRAVAASDAAFLQASVRRAPPARWLSAAASLRQRSVAFMTVVSSLAASGGRSFRILCEVVRILVLAAADLLLCHALLPRRLILAVGLFRFAGHIDAPPVEQPDRMVGPVRRSLTLSLARRFPVVRVPYADATHIKVPESLPDEQVRFLGDMFPTAGRQPCSAISSPPTLSPSGDADQSARWRSKSAIMLGAGQVVAIDPLPERLSMAEAGGATAINFDAESVIERLNDLTGGKGPEKCIDSASSQQLSWRGRADEQQSHDGKGHDLDQFRGRRAQTIPRPLSMRRESRLNPARYCS